MPKTMMLRLGTGASILGTQAILFWLVISPVWSQPWIRGFRSFFANDQLSYAAIAVTASKGLLAPVEPLTETGTSYYPSLWYWIVGLSSQVLGVPVTVTWQFLAIGCVSLGLLFVGFVAYRFSGLPVAFLFPGLAMLTGNYAILASGWWYVEIGSHSVLWGPFATLYTLNAEVVGLVLVVIAVGLLLLTANSETAVRGRVTALLVSAALLGTIANIQTYAFFTGSSLAIGFIAVYALLTFPSRFRTFAAIALLLFALVMGSIVATSIGPLPIFLLALVAAFPALFPLIKKHARLTMAAAALYGICAAPQVVRTILGFVEQDDFLSYRQASTEALDVPLEPLALAGLPVFLIAAFTAFTLIGSAGRWRNQHRIFAALLIGLGLGAALMSQNHLWGFNQEPYRFWLQYSLVGLLLLSVSTAWSLRQWRRISSPWKVATTLVGSAAMIAWAATLADVRGFHQYAREQGVIPTDDSQSDVLRQLVPPDLTLVLASRCFDPQVLKLITGAPVATFNRGLAWPDNRVEIDSFRAANSDVSLNAANLAAAGISDVITDSRCSDEWQIGDARIQPADVATFDDAQFIRWQVQ